MIKKTMTNTSACPQRCSLRGEKTRSCEGSPKQDQEAGSSRLRAAALSSALSLLASISDFCSSVIWVGLELPLSTPSDWSECFTVLTLGAAALSSAFSLLASISDLCSSVIWTELELSPTPNGWSECFIDVSFGGASAPMMWDCLEMDVSCCKTASNSKKQA